MGYYDWGPYVTVAERKANALQEIKALKKQGKAIYPVELEGRTIARSFWGKRWSAHIESFSDYSNRLPRGTRYVRNGSVCHLEIFEGEIEALVAGTELYEVEISIEKLRPASWKRIKEQCTGELGSMLELLQGDFSEKVMSTVSDPKRGLFPKPSEISFHCTCPDWAFMCKHIAATLYGVAHRLDSQPELLFVLRSVDPQELISADLAIPDADDHQLDQDLGELFGIDLDMDFADEVVEVVEAEPPKKNPKKKKLPNFKKGQSVKVKEGVVDPDDPELDLSGWRGRILSIEDDEDEKLLEIGWDSQTLRELPPDFLAQSVEEGLDWSRMYLGAADVVTSRARDKKRDVEETLAAMEEELGA